MNTEVTPDMVCGFRMCLHVLARKVLPISRDGFAIVEKLDKLDAEAELRECLDRQEVGRLLIEALIQDEEAT